jgi:hypothetical protein
LGYDERDYMLSGINAVQSPITFLYQQFSRKEQSKRQVAYMENEDRKRELLKELFRLYVDYDIISLSDEQFDDFITYLNVSDEFLKHYLRAATPREIVARMLRNLEEVYTSHQDPERLVLVKQRLAMLLPQVGD